MLDDYNIQPTIVMTNLTINKQSPIMQPRDVLVGRKKFFAGVDETMSGNSMKYTNGMFLVNPDGGHQNLEHCAEIHLFIL